MPALSADLMAQLAALRNGEFVEEEDAGLPLPPSPGPPPPNPPDLELPDTYAPPDLLRGFTPQPIDAPPPAPLPGPGAARGAGLPDLKALMADYGRSRGQETAVQEPFERSAANEATEDKLSGQIALRRNLDKLAESMSGLRGIRGVKAQTDTSDLEHKLAKHRSVVSEADRQFLKPYGIELPPNMTNDRLDKLLPQAAGMIRSRQAQQLSPYQKASLDLRERQFDESVKSRDAARKARDASVKRLQDRYGQLSEKAAVELSNTQTQLDALDRIEKAYTENQGAGTGAVEGRIEELLRKGGVGSPEFAVIQAELGDLLSRHLKAVSGTAATDEERKKVATQMMNAAQEGDTFDALLKNYRERLKTGFDNTIQGYELTGRNASQFRRPGGTVTSAPAGASGPSTALKAGERYIVDETGKVVGAADENDELPPGFSFQK